MNRITIDPAQMDGVPCIRHLRQSNALLEEPQLTRRIPCVRNAAPRRVPARRPGRLQFPTPAAMTPASPSQMPGLRVFHFRGEAVLLDADLAALYGVPTKRLLEQIRRNSARFPADYCFRLTAEEFAVLHRWFFANTGP